MTIDVHHHILTHQEDLRDPLWLSLAGFYAENLTRLRRTVTREQVVTSVYPRWIDPDGRSTLRLMDEAGIATTVLLVSAFDCDAGNLDAAFSARNEEVAAIVRTYPERLVAFCGLHPGCADAVGLLNAAAQDRGMRGVKLDPAWGDYALDDEGLRPVYARASELGIPILVHTGPRPGRADDLRCHPRALSALLAEFPALKLIAAHLSFAWWRDLIEVAKHSPNLYTDISALQVTAALDYKRFCHILRRVIDGMGVHRVLFGTDGPAFDVFISRSDWVDLIRRLPDNAPPGCAFTEKETHALLDTNARSLLGLERLTQHS